MKEQLEALLEACSSWLKAYAALENKTHYQAQYPHYYKLEKRIQQYLSQQQSTQQHDIEAIRQAHHKWMNTFKNKNFLAPTQQVNTIQTAHQALQQLSEQMAAIDWAKLNSGKLDLQYQKEVNAWKAACETWLQKHGNQQTPDNKALSLLEAFLTSFQEAQNLVHSTQV